jgi:hypothetical protein
LLVEVGDGLGGGAQDRVAEEPDVANCHATRVAATGLRHEESQLI